MAVPEHNWLVDFLNIDIENDDEIMEILTGSEPSEIRIIEALDLNAIFEFIKDWNEEYCDNHDLCPECRTPLEEMFVDVPYGDTTVQEIEGLRCPLCGY